MRVCTIWYSHMFIIGESPVNFRQASQFEASSLRAELLSMSRSLSRSTMEGRQMRVCKFAAVRRSRRWMTSVSVTGSYTLRRHLHPLRARTRPQAKALGTDAPLDPSLVTSRSYGASIFSGNGETSLLGGRAQCVSRAREDLCGGGCWMTGILTATSPLADPYTASPLNRVTCLILPPRLPLSSQSTPTSQRNGSTAWRLTPGL